MARTSEPNTILGDRLKKLREEKYTHQKTAALALGISAQVMANYEKGVREPNIKTLNIIAKEYNVTVDYLTGNSDIRNSDTENLSKVLPFNEKIIAKLIQLSADTNGLFEELLSLESFKRLVLQLYQYDTISPEQIESLADVIYPNISSKSPLEIAALRASLRTTIMKPTLCESLFDIISDFDKIRSAVNIEKFIEKIQGA